MAARAPSPKQCAARMLSGHLRALERAAGGLAPFEVTPATPAWEIKGLRTVAATLQRWGALTATGEITELGRAALEAYRERHLRA